MPELKIYPQSGTGKVYFTATGTTVLRHLNLTHPDIFTSPKTVVRKREVDTVFSQLNASHISQGTLPVVSLNNAFSGALTLNGAGEAKLNSNTTAGWGVKPQVNSHGLCTLSSQLKASDIPNLPWSKVSSALPSTAQGYGITNALLAIGGALSGNLLLHAHPSASSHCATQGYVQQSLDSTESFKVGDLVQKLSTVSHSGFLRCNGSSASETLYSGLYAVVGREYIPPQYIAGAGTPWIQQYLSGAAASPTPQAWSTTTALPRTVAYSQAIVTNSRVYLLGGEVNSAVSNMVHTAPINASGVIGAWSTHTALPIVLSKSQAVVSKNRVYLIGGVTASDVITNAVYSSVIAANGTLGAWSASTALPEGVHSAQAIVTINRIFLIGGEKSTGPNTDVYTAVINSDGSLGAWSIDSSLPADASGAPLVMTKDTIHLLGAFSAPITNEGGIGAWRTGPTLPAASVGAQVIVLRDRVLLLGGGNLGSGVASTYSSPIAEDGSLGVWTPTSALPAPQTCAQAISTSNYIYLLGGANAAGTRLNTVARMTFAYGKNNYADHYNGTLEAISQPTGTFRLPDLSALDTQQYSIFVKT